MLGQKLDDQSQLDPVAGPGPKPMIIALIPAFNEENSIAKVIVAANKHVNKVIVCDDGSTDLTAEIALSLKAEVIRHEANRGYGSAIRTLLKRAKELRADIVVTLDGDGQHDANQIPILVRAMYRTHADIVVGSRFLDQGKAKSNVPLYRRYGIKAITKLSELTSNQGLTDAQSGLRAYGRKALDGFTLSEDGMGLSIEILMEAKKRGFVIAEVPTTAQYDGLARTSTQAPLRHAMSVITSIVRLFTEDRPLMFLGLPGALSIFTGVAFGAWMLQIYAQEHRIVTNIALASMTFMLMGFFAMFTSITLYSMSRLLKKAARS
jgi:glycosyltransferase involved in cell wall biosynthesis